MKSHESSLKERLIKGIEGKKKKGSTYQDDSGIHPNHLWQDEVGYNQACDDFILSIKEGKI